MNRRAFISLLGGAAAWPLAARAQHAERVRRIGLLLAAYSATDRAGQASVRAFLYALQRLGWIDAHNISLDSRWGWGNRDQIKAQAAELVRSTPDAILVSGDPGLTALHRLAGTIPIVFTQVSDPIDSGFVASLARPGGNITGFQNFEPEMG